MPETTSAPSERASQNEAKVLGSVRIHSRIAAIGSHIPPQQFGRYLLVGAWNTLFGYGSFAALTALFEPIVPHSYILACVISGMLNITVSYLGYKWFVFKTQGNYLREWVRCVVVYSGAIVVGVILLPILVLAIRRGTPFIHAAPYIAGAVLTGVSVIYSFLGHKKFSFRTS
jgi:putative flippase GtrA